VRAIVGRAARIAASIAVGIGGLASCAVSTPGSPALEAADYEWNDMQAEKLQALRALGNPARGEISFEVCQGCHRPKGVGRPDGSYPRLAGQHDTVLIKQMTDVRAGRRTNEKMLPFADHEVLNSQDIADIAIYLSRQPVLPNNGRGPGTDLARGKADYVELCESCHGPAGEGNAAKFYPRVSGQHFKYMMREIIDIRDGKRRNANPRMVEVTRGLSDSRLEALADYMSRLPVDKPR
jgi:cytochrome c553